jgi:hypothetical protein
MGGPPSCGTGGPLGGNDVGAAFPGLGLLLVPEKPSAKPKSKGVVSPIDGGAPALQKGASKGSKTS